MKTQYLTQIILIIGIFILSPKVWADDTSQLKQQVQTLQDRVDQLEGELANKQQVPAQAVVLPANGYTDQWEDPFAQMMLMRQQMERNMRQAFGDTRAFAPKMDMKQTDREYLISMDIPGVDRDKINVEIKDGMLIISGERQSESQDKKSNQYYRQERSFGSFMQAIPLPEDAKTDKVEAKYNNGVLKVTIARQKKGQEKPEGEKITVN